MTHHLNHNDIANIKHKMGYESTVTITYEECRAMLDRIEELEHEQGKDVKAIKEGITEALKSATRDDMTVDDVKALIHEILDNS